MCIGLTRGALTDSARASWHRQCKQKGSVVALDKRCIWLQACEAVNVSTVQFTCWLVGGYLVTHAIRLSGSVFLQVKDWSLCTYRGWSQGSLVYLEPLCMCQCLWILLTFPPFGCKLNRESPLQMNTSPGWHRHVLVFTAWFGCKNEQSGPTM